MTSTDPSPLVSARSLALRYGSARILNGIDLDIAAGSHLALTGRSGSGKTTLLLVLAGLLAPSEGSIAWPGLAADPTRRRGQIGMVFQAPSLMPELTALQNVTLPLRLRGTDRQHATAAAMLALGNLAAADVAQALPPQLSGGQQQRVAIARALAGGHRLVLADEPTGALDRANAQEAALALRDGVAATGGALVLATHDPELAELFDQQLVVADGSIRHSLRSR
ncbi:MAG: ATP-binding cassette domain-containing protein [Ornithinibacter sp.]